VQCTVVSIKTLGEQLYLPAVFVEEGNPQNTNLAVWWFWKIQWKRAVFKLAGTCQTGMTQQGMDVFGMKMAIIANITATSSQVALTDKRQMTRAAHVVEDYLKLLLQTGMLQMLSQAARILHLTGLMMSELVVIGMRLKREIVLSLGVLWAQME